MEYARLSISNYKPWVFVSGFSSLLSILLAAYGDFQRVNVYEKSTGLNMPAYQYVVTKEFSKINPNISGLERVARIERSYTSQKIAYAIGGIISGCACLMLAVQEDKLQPIKDYKEVKQTELQKMQIDMDLAVSQKVEAEKTKVTAVNILEELLENETYRRLKKQQVNTESGTTEEDEPEQDKDNSWNPFMNDYPETSTPNLSAEAQKVLKWLQRKQPDLAYITVEMCRASGCVSGAKTADIKAYFNEIVAAKIGECNERGDIRLT